VKRVSEEDDPVQVTVTGVTVSDGSGGAEEPGKAGVSSTASLNGMRRIEKAEVLEKAQPDIQGTRG
jgi:hypothetical protein